MEVFRLVLTLRRTGVWNGLIDVGSEEWLFCFETEEGKVDGCLKFEDDGSC